MGFVLVDIRNNRFFGGGRVDHIFTYWVSKIEEAKIFNNMQAIQNIVNGLHERTVKFGPEVIEAAGMLPYEHNTLTVLVYKDGQLIPYDQEAQEQSEGTVA